MTEILLQSALAASKSNHLAAQASQIRQNCLAQHVNNNNTNSLLSCPQCYEALLEALKAHYTPPPPTTDPQQQQQQQQQQQEEWFTPRTTFLTALPPLIDSAAAYQVPPQAIDNLLRDERSRWYAERVRGSLLRLLVEDTSGARGAVFEKLEDLQAAAAAATAAGGGGDGGGDPVGAAREIAGILRGGPLAPEPGVRDVAGRLVAAGEDRAGRVEVLREVFFAGAAGEDGAVPEDCQRYLEMLAQQGLSMEQVVDRILEERQAAAGAREQTNKLSQRLDELRRARATHELQKSKKAQRRESQAQQRVPDELYELPACAVCGGAPSTDDFFCCSICTILAGRGVQQQQTVFCSQSCEERGHAPHAETHLCASSSKCIQLQRNPQASAADTPRRPKPHDVHFCTECLTSLRQPTLWCSLACADANFQRHRDEVHLPERKKLGLSVDDEQQFEYDNNNGSDASSRTYRAKDIRALTTSLEEAAVEWEERNRVRLQGVP